MRCAELFAERSTCARLRVGAIVCDEPLLRALGVGYNGSASGAPNACDDAASIGACGCLHAELNALLKASSVERAVLFVTSSPCVACAKACVNANIIRVVYRTPYRVRDGVRVLLARGVRVERLDDDGALTPIDDENAGN